MLLFRYIYLHLTSSTTHVNPIMVYYTGICLRTMLGKRGFFLSCVTNNGRTMCSVFISVYCWRPSFNQSCNKIIYLILEIIVYMASSIKFSVFYFGYHSKSFYRMLSSKNVNKPTIARAVLRICSKYD